MDNITSNGKYFNYFFNLFYSMKKMAGKKYNTGI